MTLFYLVCLLKSKKKSTTNLDISQNISHKAKKIIGILGLLTNNLPQVETLGKKSQNNIVMTLFYLVSLHIIHNQLVYLDHKENRKKQSS